MPAPRKLTSDSASELRAASAARRVVDLGLGLPVGKLQRPAQAQVGGDVLEQLVDRLGADRLEHLGPVAVSR